MKPILLIAGLLCVTLISNAQSPNTVINCWISNGRVNYGNLAELLPDSIATNLLVDPRKKFNMRNFNKILLWLEQRGWKLMTVDISVSGFNGTAGSSSTYIMSKDIYLDDAARALFMQKLETNSK